MRRSAPFILALLSAGCASNAGQYNVDYLALSSQLYVENPDGSMVQPLAGQIVGIADINIGPDAISVVPGTYWVRTNCPFVPGSIQATHGQSVQHEFVVGKAYILRCKDGYPVIEPRE